MTETTLSSTQSFNAFGSKEKEDLYIQDMMKECLYFDFHFFQFDNGLKQVTLTIQIEGWLKLGFNSGIL